MNVLLLFHTLHTTGCPQLKDAFLGSNWVKKVQTFCLEVNCYKDMGIL